MKAAFALLLLAAALPASAFDANGAKLGASEAEVKKRFPSAHCKPLEWKTDAADRRCDDARVSLGGAEARVTFYLKADAVRSFNVRFDSKDLKRVAAHLKAGYGAPAAEATEVIARPGKEDRRIYKLRWERGTDHAVLTSPEKGKRAELEAWRGDFVSEIYKVR